MYQSPEYQSIINVARTYSEGFKEFPADKVKKKEDKTKDAGRKKNMKAARIAHTDSDIKPIAQDAVKSVEKDNKLKGKKKGLEKLLKKTPSHKNTAYKLEGQRRKDLDNRYGPKKEELMSYLLDAGIVDNEVSAAAVANHLSEEAIQIILEE